MKNSDLTGRIKYNWFSYGGGIYFLKKEWIDEKCFYDRSNHPYSIVARFLPKQ